MPVILSVRVYRYLEWMLTISPRWCTVLGLCWITWRHNSMYDNGTLPHKGFHLSNGFKVMRYWFLNPSLKHLCDAATICSSFLYNGYHAAEVGIMTELTAYYSRITSLGIRFLFNASISVLTMKCISNLPWYCQILHFMHYFMIQNSTLVLQYFLGALSHLAYTSVQGLVKYNWLYF